MQVKVRFFTVLREVTGKKEEVLRFDDGNEITVRKVIEVLTKRYGQPFNEYIFDQKNCEVRGFLQFFINGLSISTSQGLDTELHEGDVVAVVPPVGGG